MKAVVCQQFGSIADLVLEEVAETEPGRGEVGIAVHAAGINFPDILTVEGKYQFKPDLPFVPGVEVAGDRDVLGRLADVGVGEHHDGKLTVRRCDERDERAELCLELGCAWISRVGSEHGLRVSRRLEAGVREDP